MKSYAHCLKFTKSVIESFVIGRVGKGRVYRTDEFWYFGAPAGVSAVNYSHIHLSPTSCVVGTVSLLLSLPSCWNKANTCTHTHTYTTSSPTAICSHPSLCFQPKVIFLPLKVHACASENPSAPFQINFYGSEL